MVNDLWEAKLMSNDGLGHKVMPYVASTLPSHGTFLHHLP
jgi:hypothetical protein